MKKGNLPISQGTIIDISVRRYTFDVKVLSQKSGTPQTQFFKAGSKNNVIIITSEINIHNPKLRDFQIVIKYLEKSKPESELNFISGNIIADDKEKMKKLDRLIVHLKAEGFPNDPIIDEVTIKKIHQLKFLY